MVYRFIGSESVIGDVGLKNIGDPITLSAEVSPGIILGGGSVSGFAGAVPLLTDEDFAEIFGPGPVNRYSEDFSVKLSAATQRLQAFRRELEG